jgi:hypothetical protein
LQLIFLSSIVFKLKTVNCKPEFNTNDYKPVVSHPVSGRDVKSAYEIKGAKNSPHKQREQEAILKEEININ